MNFHHAIKKYNDSNISSKIESGNKHEFIKIVLSELYKNLNVLKYCIENEKITSSKKSKSFSKILTSLMILMNSLDFKNGEPIASNLFNLYEYCRKVVLKSYKNLDTKGLDDTILIIDDILTAWKEIG